MMECVNAFFLKKTLLYRFELTVSATVGVTTTIATATAAAATKTGVKIGFNDGVCLQSKTKEEEKKLLSINKKRRGAERRW